MFEMIREHQYLVKYVYGGLATMSMDAVTADSMAKLNEVDEVRRLSGYSKLGLDPTYLEFKEKAYESLS